MKVYDILLLLVILHISGGVVNALGVWAVPAGMVPENISMYDPEHMTYPGGFGIAGILGPSVFSAVMVVGFMVGGLAISLFTRVPTHQLIAVVIFAAFFMLLTGNTATILANFYVPGALISAFVALNGIMLLVGILQIATGVSLEHTA